MFPNAFPSSSVIGEIDQDVARQHLLRLYRPVVVVLLINLEGRVFLAQSAKNANYWGPPQGGINKDESVLAAVVRELAEETGISSNDITIDGYCGNFLLDIPGREKRDGFERGKKYYYFWARLNRDVQVRLQPEELSSYQWVEPRNLAERLASIPKEKRDQILAAMKRVVLQ